MKFTVEHDVLKEAISWTAKSTPQRPALPVLAGIWIHAEGQVVSLSTFDYEVSSRNQFAAEVEEPGDAVVNGRMIATICSNLPKAPVQLELEAGKVKITCGKFYSELLTMNLDDYPSLPSHPPVLGSVDSSDFAHAVSQVAFSASTEGALPLLSVVRCQFDDENITLMATDRYRLAVRTLPWKAQGPTDVACMVRAKQLGALASMVSGAGLTQISLGSDESDGAAIFGLEAQGRKLTSTLTSGDYPPVLSLFPPSAPVQAVIKREELLQTIQRVSAIADRSAASVRMSFFHETGLLRIEAGSGADAQAREELECVFTPGDLDLEPGAPMVVVFSASYIQEGIKALDTDYVRFSFTHPVKPAVLTGQSQLTGEDSQEFRYLIMPIRQGS